jgi:hypothetical protein
MQPGTEFYREHLNIYVTYTFLISSFVQNDQVYKKDKKLLWTSWQKSEEYVCRDNST